MQLTVFRILLIPVFALLFLIPWHYAPLFAAAVFGLASITDWLDGYLARKWNQVTPLGAFLDPVADKLMVVVALVILVAHEKDPWLLLGTLSIITREVYVTALREWMASRDVREQVAVAFVGKWKAAVQMVAISVLICSATWPFAYWPGLMLLYVAAILGIWSMIDYTRSAWPHLSLKA